MKKSICDRCNNYEVSSGGCIEICHAKKYGSQVIAWIDDDYISQRMNGAKNSCKGYKPLKTTKAK